VPAATLTPACVTKPGQEIVRVPVKFVPSEFQNVNDVRLCEGSGAQEASKRDRAYN
jgi:hypothetical protein